MGKDLDDLIQSLSSTGSYSDDDPISTRFRDNYIAELKNMGPQVVPVLVERLDDLLAATAGYFERILAVQAAWDAWYEESDRLTDEHGLNADIDPYRTIHGKSLPQRSVQDDNYREPITLKQGIIEALHQFGDQRAAHVLIAALADRACIHSAALALREIHADSAVPALLDAVTIMDRQNSFDFDALLATLLHYAVSMTQARERFEAETSPQGRVNLMHLMTKLPDDGAGPPDESQIRDSLIVLALDDRDTSFRWRAIDALNKIDNRTVNSNPFSDDWDEPALADIVRSAIALAAHGNPPGYGGVLARGLRRIRNTPAGVRAVESILTQDSPEPNAKELRLALRLALGVHKSALDDPMPLIRALHRLSSHSQVGDRALTTLRRTCWELLFPQMVHSNKSRRREARTIFGAIGTPHEHNWFDRYHAYQPFWRRLWYRFMRR